MLKPPTSNYGLKMGFYGFVNHDSRWLVGENEVLETSPFVSGTDDRLVDDFIEGLETTPTGVVTRGKS